MRVVYLCVLCAFLACFAAIAWKLTFWPVCASPAPCDGWTVASLTSIIFGVGGAFLTIIGAVMLATWWTEIDKRVEKRVTELTETYKGKLEALVNTTSEKTDKVEKRLFDLEVRQQEFLRIMAYKDPSIAVPLAQLAGREEDL